MFNRRREPKRPDSAAQAAVNEIAACFASDPDEWEVRGAVVFFDGADDTNPYGVVNMGFTEEDRAAIYMDFDLAALVYEAQRVPDVATGEAVAAAWVGARGQRFEFRNLPGIYQAAYVAWSTGLQLESHESQFMWVMPSVGGQVPTREFPPRTGPTDMTPEPGKASFILLPREAVDGLFRTRGW